MQLRPVVLFVALLAGWLVPRSAAAERIFDVSGVVRAPLRNNVLLVAHDDIPGFMRAMTMSFRVADPAEAASLKPGDRVRFRLHVTEAASRATDFAIVGRESEPAAIAAPSPTASRPRLREGDSVPAFALTTADNRAFAQAELRGRATLVTFIFTRCPVPEYCPTMALRFGQLQKALLADPTLADRARLLSITLDPEFDSPAVLKAYGEGVGANPAVWQFATGSKEEITALTRAFAAYREQNGVTLDHTLCTALVDGAGRVQEIWRGNAWNTNEVLAALKRAARE